MAAGFRSEAKARAVAVRRPGRWVLGADTIVVEPIDREPTRDKRRLTLL